MRPVREKICKKIEFVDAPKTSTQRSRRLLMQQVQYTKVGKISDVTSARKNLHKNLICYAIKKLYTRVEKITHVKSAKRNLGIKAI
ncbi:unnamed protein product [Trichogramma brassicae]|uniref:Uncharacterized protein n=1 Tax=Trichogramma brassicae TaxID=86971 RepID=A0A6H5J2V8_9HYME|nr:unnamed protein product [Trichogramma brassicae]